MSGKFTPGPWNVLHHDHMISIHTGDTDKDYVSENGIDLIDPTICGIWADTESDKRKEAEANAKLIAAAPDLLKALQAAKFELEMYMMSKTKADVTVLNKAKQAIKKATA